MAARKAAKPAATPQVRTVSTDERTEPSISPELVEVRERALEAEKDRPVQEPTEPSISPELVEARERALKAEKDRKTF
jgi:hypothetical protein